MSSNETVFFICFLVVNALFWAYMIWDVVSLRKMVREAKREAEEEKRKLADLIRRGEA